MNKSYWFSLTCLVINALGVIAYVKYDMSPPLWFAGFALGFYMATYLTMDKLYTAYTGKTMSQEEIDKLFNEVGARIARNKSDSAP